MDLFLETRLFGSITISLTKVTSLPLMILRPQLISTYTEEELSLRCQHLWRYFLIPFNDENNDYYLIENSSTNLCLSLVILSMP